MHLRLRLFGLVFAAASVVPTLAFADVGPPDTSCTVEKRCPGQGVECRYVNSDPDAGELACMKDAEARGLESVCSRGGGTVGSNVYCPKGSGASGASSGTSGTTPSKSGCSTSPHGDASAFGAGVVLATVAICIARARRRACAVRRSPSWRSRVRP